MYFICENKLVINDNVLSTTVFKNKVYAEAIFKQKDKNVYEYMKRQPPIYHSLEAFYLVHESLFDEILKEHCRE